MRKVPSSMIRRVPASWPGTVAVALVVGCGCGGGEGPDGVGSGRRSGGEPGPSRLAGGDPTPEPGASGGGLRFRAEPLPFRYERGESGAAWPVETTGGGVAILDHDGDGDLDLFFAQGQPLPAGSSESPPADVLLENLGDGRFEDASSRVGLVPKGYGQGATAADYDGDGDPDVYVSRYGPNTLWRNDGGRFVDATAGAGVGCALWSLGSAFFDHDGDGDLDLFVANYFDFDPADAPFGRDPETGAPDYGMPAMFPGQPDVLYRNEGGGRFADVTDRAGVAGSGRGMGVLATDLDGDGRPDLFVANDAQANAVWRNRGDGTFEEVGERSGLAYNGEGMSEANMGIAFGDTDGDLLPEVLVTHFFDEHDTLWRPLPGRPGAPLIYQDQTREAGIAVDSRPMTGWGTLFEDFDLDGDLDLFVANGHLRREPGQPFPYENPPLLWRNDGRGRFENVSARAGPYFDARHVARGVASGDLDGDGDADLVVVHHHAPSVVLWNESPRSGRSVVVELVGRPPNTDAIGARLVATVGGHRLLRTVDGGGSYLSAHGRTILLGTGDAPQVDRIEVRWPSGRVEARSAIPAGTTIRWSEAEDATDPATGAVEGGS